MPTRSSVHAIYNSMWGPLCDRSNLCDPLPPAPVPVSVVQQMKMLIKETLSPVLCVCVSVSVRVTRQRGASNPCPATARQLNGSVSSPARNEQCMIYFRTQFACFLKPGNRNLPRPIPQPPFSCIDKASTGSARSRRKGT